MIGDYMEPKQKNKPNKQTKKQNKQKTKQNKTKQKTHWRGICI